MSNENRMYVAIDLKSFYASVECMDRGLDPLKTNLLVADESRTEKTICLAVSPSLKRHGIPGRARLFEVNQKVSELNKERASKTKDKRLSGSSTNADEIDAHGEYAIDFIIAPPRMSRYMEVSNRIYDIYLKYVSPSDMHIYSVDEVFIDVTDYLKIYDLTPHELAMKMINDVLDETGITATAGIGTNLYLSKIAMDIVAKHMPPDKNGVRIAELDEMSYRKELWAHEPLTDFWRVGTGISKKLNKYGIHTMGDIARCSLGTDKDFYNEDLLYKLFGVNAELIIDHAWGYEPCMIKDIKGYVPKNNSISSGQVLKRPYTFDETRIIIREMTDLLVLDLVKKKLVTNQVVLHIGYDVKSLEKPEVRKLYSGEVTLDRYGREVPKPAHGSCNLEAYGSSTDEIMNAVLSIYERTVNKNLLIRRLSITACNVIPEYKAKKQEECTQLDLFTVFGMNADGSVDGIDKAKERERKKEKERALQEAVLSIQDRFGKNAILKGTSLEEGATTIERNGTIGGHKA